MNIDEKIQGQYDKYLDSVRKIILRNIHLFGDVVKATPKQDMEEGFDLVLSFVDTKIALRLRQEKYYSRYRQVTIRSRSRYGGRTEIDKIRDGLGDYYLFGWEDGSQITRYCIFDIRKFTNLYIENPSGINIPNRDGTCFNAYNLKDIRNALLAVYNIDLSE